MTDDELREMMASLGLGEPTKVASNPYEPRPDLTQLDAVELMLALYPDD